MHSLTRDLNLKHTFEKLEKKNKIKYSELPNYKLLKNLGHALDSFDQLFKVNDVLFDKYQDEMMKLEEIYLSNINDIDKNISNVTSIHVYLRNSNNDFNPSEISDRKIFVDNLNATRISFIEYDEKFTLTKKLSIGELKFEACKALNVSKEEYVVLNKNLELMIYCVDLYQEIFLRNLKKGFIENSSRFFQFNPYYNVNKKIYFINLKSILKK